MKHLKVSSAVLSAIMCMSMVMTPVAVMADETETPSQTQTTEAAEEKETEEPEESAEQDPEVEEDKEVEGEAKNEAEDAYIAKGKCGKKLKWTLDKKGTLKVTGKGAMTNYKWNEPSNTYSTPWFKYKSKIKKVVVSKGVTTIGAYAFCINENLTSVSLPKGIKAIGYAAFAGCIRLKKISLPKTLRSISKYAFCESALESISIPKGVTEIKEGTFGFCQKLKSVSIPATVKTIGSEAFRDCIGLKSISIPFSVRTIESNAFYNCSNLAKVNVPVCGLFSINRYAFYGCSELTEFVMPLSVTSIGSNAFSNCTKLGRVWINVKQKKNMSSNAFSNDPNVKFDENEHYMIGDSFSDGKLSYAVSNPSINGTGTVDVVAINNPDDERVVIPAVVESNGVKYKVTRMTGTTSQYNDKLKVKTLIIGANLTLIADGAFSGCQNLESVTGGAGLRSIGAKAFAKCPKLKVFSINSKTLWKIGDSAFSGDTALTTLQLKKTKKLVKSGVKNSLKESSVKTIKVKKSKVKKYKKIFKKANSGKSVKVKK